MAYKGGQKNQGSLTLIQVGYQKESGIKKENIKTQIQTRLLETSQLKYQSQARDLLNGCTQMFD